MPRGRRAGDDGAYGCSVRAYGSDAAGLAGTEKMQKKRKGLLIMTHECEEKKNEIETTIRELRAAAASIYDITARLANVLNLVGDTDAVAERAYSLEEVRAVLADKSRQGHTAEIRALLQKYGASKLSGIDPTNYKALLADAEVLTDAT